MRTMMGLLIHLLFLISGHQSGATDAAAFYAVGAYDCIAVEAQHEIRIGSPRVVLAPGKKPLRVSVDVMVPWTERSTERRPHGDCKSAYLSELADRNGDRTKVTQFAHISPLPEEHSDYEVFFAVPPSGAIIIGGAPAALGTQARRQLVDGVRSSLPPSWRADRTLVRAYRYGLASGHVIDELYVGLPTHNLAGTATPIKGITIRRFFLIDGTLAASEEYKRESGVEERADSAAPELTYENWWRDWDETVAFVSRDEGHSWERLSTDSAFEGIHWSVHSLNKGLPELFHRWLYTYH